MWGRGLPSVPWCPRSPCGTPVATASGSRSGRSTGGACLWWSIRLASAPPSGRWRALPARHLTAPLAGNRAFPLDCVLPIPQFYPRFPMIHTAPPRWWVHGVVAPPGWANRSARPPSALVSDASGHPGCGSWCGPVMGASPGGWATSPCGAAGARRPQRTGPAGGQRAASGHARWARRRGSGPSAWASHGPGRRLPVPANGVHPSPDVALGPVAADRGPLLALAGENHDGRPPGHSHRSFWPFTGWQGPGASPGLGRCGWGRVARGREGRRCPPRTRRAAGLRPKNPRFRRAARRW